VTNFLFWYNDWPTRLVKAWMGASWTELNCAQVCPQPCCHSLCAGGHGLRQLPKVPHHRRNFNYICLLACSLANPSNTTVSQSHRLWAHGGTCAPTSSLAICCNGETPTRKARVTTTSSCRPSIGQTQTAASEPTRQGQPARHPDTTSDPIEVWSTSHFMNPSHPPLMCECLTCQRGKSSTYIH